MNVYGLSRFVVAIVSTIKVWLVEPQAFWATTVIV
jgi:hypothetical protein